jgi:hypothetical protein
MSDQTQPARRYEAVVQDNGHIEHTAPFSAGECVLIMVMSALGHEVEFHDITLAAESSLDFWNNSFDDEDWSNV